MRSSSIKQIRFKGQFACFEGIFALKLSLSHSCWSNIANIDLRYKQIPNWCFSLDVENTWKFALQFLISHLVFYRLWDYGKSDINYSHLTSLSHFFFFFFEWRFSISTHDEAYLLVLVSWWTFGVRLARGGSRRWKGGGPKCWPMTGVPGGWPPGGGPGGRAPWWGLQGGRAPLRREILDFWTQFARFGAILFANIILKISWSISNKSVFFFFFFCELWNRPRPNITKWVIHCVHASPSSSPSRSPVESYILFLAVYAFANRSCNINRGSSRCSIVRVQSENFGGPGSRAPWWGSGE